MRGVLSSDLDGLFPGGSDLCLPGVLLDVDGHGPAALCHSAHTPRPGARPPEAGGGVPGRPGAGRLAPCLPSPDLEDGDVVPLAPGPRPLPGQGRQAAPQAGAPALSSVETGAPGGRVGLVVTETVGPRHLPLEADVGGVGGGVPHSQPGPGAGLPLAPHPSHRHDRALPGTGISDARDPLHGHPGDSLRVPLRVGPLNDFLGVRSLDFRLLIV